MSVTSQRTSFSRRRLIDFHRWMLMDSERMRTFSSAIRHAVQPGHTVLDIGTGTGILAILAVKAGARRVYAMDACADILEVAQELAVANGCADRIAFLHGDSRTLSLPQKVDVVISETLGACPKIRGSGLRQETLAFALRRCLANGKKFLRMEEFSPRIFDLSCRIRERETYDTEVLDAISNADFPQP